MGVRWAVGIPTCFDGEVRRGKGGVCVSVCECVFCGRCANKKGKEGWPQRRSVKQQLCPSTWK